MVIKSISDFHDWLRELKSEEGFIYRGQSNAEWRVDCSAYRRLAKGYSSEDSDNPVDAFLPTSLPAYLKFLIGKARMRGFIPPDLNDTCTDLELLANLQHHGAATGLIDFTTQPLVALWFTCNELENEDGAIYAYPYSEAKEINEREELDEKIDSFYTGEKGKPSLWQPSATGNRVVAQGSVFLFGVSTIVSPEMKKLVIGKNNKKMIIGDSD